MRIPALRTERLLVRELGEDDLPAVSVLQPGDRSAWLRWTAAGYEQLEALMQPPYGERAITLREGGELVGLVGLVPSLGPFGLLPSWPSEPAGLRPEVGLFWQLFERHRGRGYATEAARALADHGFAELSLARIVATTEHANTASVAVMRRLGMRIEQNPTGDPPWFQVVGVLDSPG